MLKKMLGAAGVAYAVVNSIYGNADAVNLGFTTVDNEWLVYGIPALVSLVYPAASKYLENTNGIKFPTLHQKPELEKQLDLLKGMGDQASHTNDCLIELFETMDQIKPAEEK